MAKWTEVQKQQWFQQQEIQRSYQSDVVHKILNLNSAWDVVQYGALSLNADAYPLYLIRSKTFDPSRKTILITGGVHGYETSGVHGALGFFERAAHAYSHEFNFVCAPCISPWAYETINRWNNHAIDPNRSFYENSPSEECRLFMKAIAEHQAKPFVHFDLHETTDTDNTIFRPMLEKRDGIDLEFSEIPDGFYVVGDEENPCPAFQKAIIEAVRPITHIAPQDQQGKLIGTPVEQEGVINYPLKKLFLCAGVTNAPYTATTEVYPDSPKITPEVCIEAQIAAIKGGLDYLRRFEASKGTR